MMFLGCLLFIMPSCKKSFEKEPSDFIGPENYFKTEEQLNYALNGVYSTLAESGLYANNMIARLGLDADQSYNRYSHDEASVSDYNYTSADTKILAYWRALYLGINRANLLLENIDKPDMDNGKREKIKGQTLFLRAYFYFLLVTRFGDVPLVLNTVSSASSEALQVARTPVKEVYHKILKDMEAASLLVDDIDVVGSGGRISKSAVWGIMARVCLYMAGNPINDVSKYTEARQWAEKVIISGKHQLNPSFQQIFINYAQDKYDYKESIWEVEFWGNGTGIYTNLGGYVGRNNGIGSTQDPEVGYAAGMSRTSTVLFKLYNANDLRRDWSIAPFRYVGDAPAVATNWNASQIVERYCGKWRRIYETVLPRSTTRTSQNFPILRYSDVLLMFAEADNFIDDNDGLQRHEAINKVRRRGFGKPIDVPDASIDFTGMDKAAFLEQIQNERSRELAFECLRKDDLIRWNIFLSSMKYALNDITSTTTAATDAKRTFTNVSARDVLWPIPLYELGVNKKLVQNKGW